MLSKCLQVQTIIPGPSQNTFKQNPLNSKSQYAKKTLRIQLCKVLSSTVRVATQKIATLQAIEANPLYRDESGPKGSYTMHKNRLQASL